METRSIIYVENELNFANLIYRQLTRKGYDVTLSSRGQESVRLVQAHPNKYSLLIIGLNLNGIKGIEIAGLIKGICPDIHVILTTGDMTIDEHGLKKSANIDEVMFKPFLINELFETVKRLLDKESHEHIKH